MNSFETYKLFLALNNHFFQVNYDYFKYSGGVPVKPETFEKKRQDEKYRYERIGKKFQEKEDLENFFVANLLEAKKRMWVGALFGGDADEIYLQWQGRTQAIQYNLISELKRVIQDNDGFNCLFKSEDGQHPELLKAYMRGTMSLETFVVLDMCLDFIPNLDHKLGDDRNWMLVKNKALKYRPFLERLNINIGNIRKAVLKTVKELGVT